MTPLFGRSRIDDEPEVRSQRAVVSVKRQTAQVADSSLDLTDKPKVLFLNGLGGTGKTLLARWLGWRMAERGQSALIAALDPQNRSLADWFAGVEQPETSDPNQTQRFLRDVLSYLTSNSQSGLLDFGGGDVSLAKLIDLMPSLAADMVAADVHPIALYCLSARVDDLTPLQTMEEMGFKPEATMLVLNEGRVDSMLTREEAFARIMRHSDFRAAVARGAVPVWMPRLDPDVAATIEARRLTFGMARDGLVPPNAKFAPIGGFERSMVRRWLERMEQEFAAVSSWLL